MMTGMERLNAAIQGTAADRIPVFCNLLDQGAGAPGPFPEGVLFKRRKRGHGTTADA